MLEDFDFARTTPNWNWLLDSNEVGKKFFYKEREPYGIITTHFDPKGVLMINSGTVDDQPFSIGMRRYLLMIGRNCTKLVLQSTKKDSSINRYLEYDDASGCFHKGL